ncbi:unnamed protein product [Arctogadus glacialis]
MVVSWAPVSWNPMPSILEAFEEEEGGTVRADQMPTLALIHSQCHGSKVDRDRGPHPPDSQQGALVTPYSPHSHRQHLVEALKSSVPGATRVGAAGHSVDGINR